MHLKDFACWLPNSAETTAEAGICLWVGCGVTLKRRRELILEERVLL